MGVFFNRDACGYAVSKLYQRNANITKDGTRERDLPAGVGRSGAFHRAGEKVRIAGDSKPRQAIISHSIALH
jgi:hypothetical protein